MIRRTTLRPRGPDDVAELHEFQGAPKPWRYRAHRYWSESFSTRAEATTTAIARGFAAVTIAQPPPSSSPSP